jgi:hypothetical protein
VRGTLSKLKTILESKPGGIAKVAAIWPTKIAKDYYIISYDVEYPHLGQTEKGIQEMFVVCGTIRELNALVVAYQGQAECARPRLSRANYAVGPAFRKSVESKKKPSAASWRHKRGSMSLSNITGRTSLVVWPWSMEFGQP